MLLAGSMLWSVTFHYCPFAGFAILLAGWRHELPLFLSDTGFLTLSRRERKGLCYGRL